MNFFSRGIGSFPSPSAFSISDQSSLTISFIAIEQGS